MFTVDFMAAGHPFQGLNGGPDFTFNDAVSFQIDGEDQTEAFELERAF